MAIAPAGSRPQAIQNPAYRRPLLFALRSPPPPHDCSRSRGTYPNSRHYSAYLYDPTEDFRMRVLMIATAVALSASAALAQQPPANNGPNNNAVNSSQGNNPGAPVAGANSFTEG